MVTNDKKQLRADIRRLRSSLSSEYLADASNQIQKLILSSDQFKRSQTILIYVSMPGEPATEALILAALGAGKTICVPRCRQAPEMDAVVIRSLSELRPGTMNIPEPDAQLPSIDPEIIDLVLVPCMSASSSGARLGHGGGYYDRFLSQTSAYRLCLCFHRLLSDSIPLLPHDLVMDGVVTENGFLCH